MSKKTKKKTKTASLFYTTIDEEVSPTTAYLQAASLLDIAAVAAVQYGDTVAMASVAHHWMEMAVLMQGGGHDQDEPEDGPITETKVIGFGTTKMREVAEDDARKSRKGSERIPR